MTATNDFLALLDKMTKRAREIERELSKTYNRREWMAKHGEASFFDVASAQARKEFS